jgi:hypothetical protein
MSNKTLTRPEPLTRPAFVFEADFLLAFYVESCAISLREALAKPWVKRAGYVVLARDDEWQWHHGRVYERRHFFEFQNL